jgi:hypothetical protein
MGHFSEMNFLFTNTPAPDITNPTKIIKNTVQKKVDGNTIENYRSIFSPQSNDYAEYDKTHFFVFKGQEGIKKPITSFNEISDEWNAGNRGPNVKNHIKTQIYEKIGNKNPYLSIIDDFNGEASSKSLTIKASDLAYLRELGVHPINRMVVLRRFAEGIMLPESLDELEIEPISTVIGWIPHDENFGKFDFNEGWTLTNKRLDQLLNDLINDTFKESKIKTMTPIPGFAQGLMFGLLNKADFSKGQDSPWDWNKIPIGDPNVLAEGPYRDASRQNLSSSFDFNINTTYEQKFIGDVDPGAAMIDIIDNLLKMGTSDMKYWLDSNSGIIKDAKAAINSGDELNAWWVAISSATTALWDTLADTISNIKTSIGKVMPTTDTGSIRVPNAEDLKKIKESALTALENTLQLVLTSTLAKYRWEMKGSFELMTGRDSATPWYLTIGNPYSPWLASNHIIVKTVSVETSNEVGFNDMPMWLKVTINAGQSRNLGRNEIMRMFNNSFLREYSKANIPEFTGTHSADAPVDTPVSGADDKDKQVDKNVKDMQSYAHTGDIIPQLDYGTT